MTHPFAYRSAHKFLLRSRSLLGWSTLFGLLVFPLLGFAQLRNAHWVYGTNLHLSFVDGSYQRLAHSDTVSERNACISDPAGNLALLVDDRGIRNGQFGYVAGGTALGLGWYATMGNQLILPHPGGGSRYWVFTVEAGSGARAGCTEVDLSLNGGAGAVVGGGITWFMQDCTAKLSATVDEAGTGYWVALHKASGNAYHAYHLTAAGFDPTPVISHTGRSFVAYSGEHYNSDRWGPMVFSVQGDRLASVVHGVALDTNGVEVCTFDRASGAVSLEFMLYDPPFHYSIWPQTGDTAYTVIQPWMRFLVLQGLAFDATGDFLFSSGGRPGPSSNGMVQYPLYLGDPALLRDSTIQLYGSIDQFPPLHTFPSNFLAYAPDGRLYNDRRGYPSFEFTFSFPGSAFWPWRWEETEALVQQQEWDSLPAHIHTGGFPNQSRNYHDSHPVGLGLPEARLLPDMQLFPNPTGDRSTLVWPGEGRPTTLRWWDLMGRVLRTVDHRYTTSPWSLAREGLPPGVYMLELLGGDRSLARTCLVYE